ncbi:MAG: hypothetical protein ACE5EN_04495 [Nitrospinota bacterium]
MRYEDPFRQEMWDWFHKHFIHTDQCDPPESERSGYQYVCGGPYFPGDLLRKEFGDKFDSALIDDVVAALEAEDSEWARASHY